MFTGRLLGGVRLMSSPSIRIRPSLGVSNPASMRSRVVLPQPDGPRSAKNSPSSIARLTLSTAIIAPKRLVTFSKRMMVLAGVTTGFYTPPVSTLAMSLPCRRRAIAVSATVSTMRIVEAALTSGVTENRTME